MRIKSRILSRREGRGMTISALAGASGVPSSTVEKWCQMGVPTAVLHAVRIARALDTSVEELVEGVDE